MTKAGPKQFMGKMRWSSTSKRRNEKIAADGPVSAIEILRKLGIVATGMVRLGTKSDR